MSVRESGLPTPAAADLGIAMGSGTDAAIGAARLTLVRGDIDSLVSSRDQPTGTHRADRAAPSVSLPLPASAGPSGAVPGTAPSPCS
ncbi:hypothetical protein BOQ63_014760 [Streptomyces viridifaciens]|nr:hypothetical protein BOQ63_014760 [Streptomyces viridifaciens]